MPLMMIIFYAALFAFFTHWEFCYCYAIYADIDYEFTLSCQLLPPLMPMMLSLPPLPMMLPPFTFFFATADAITPCRADIADSAISPIIIYAYWAAAIDITLSADTCCHYYDASLYAGAAIERCRWYCHDDLLFCDIITCHAIDYWLLRRRYFERFEAAIDIVSPPFRLSFLLLLYAYFRLRHTLSWLRHVDYYAVTPSRRFFAIMPLYADDDTRYFRRAVATLIIIYAMLRYYFADTILMMAIRHCLRRCHADDTPMPFIVIYSFCQLPPLLIAAELITFDDAIIIIMLSLFTFTPPLCYAYCRFITSLLMAITGSLMFTSYYAWGRHERAPPFSLRRHCRALRDAVTMPLRLFSILFI